MKIFFLFAALVCVNYAPSSKTAIVVSAQASNSSSSSSSTISMSTTFYTVSTTPLGNTSNVSSETTLFVPRWDGLDSDATPNDVVCFVGSATNLERDIRSIHGGGGMGCTATNGCGVHVHSGTDCANTETQGGHWYNADELSTDPWATVGYQHTNFDGDGRYASCVRTGYDVMSDPSRLVGHVFIIHSEDGSRVSCGPIIESSYAGTTAATLAADTVPIPGTDISISDSSGYVKVMTNVQQSITDGVCYMGYAMGMEPNVESFLLGTGSDQCNVTNGCGTHIHSGTGCENADAQGGHYYDDYDLEGGDDPWLLESYYSTDGSGVAAMIGCAITGAGATDYDSRPFIVHGIDGGRLLCGLLTGDDDADSNIDASLDPGTVLVGPGDGAAATPPSCMGTCEDGEYCQDLVGKCLPVGECILVEDCDNPDNQPYPVEYCLGTLECQEGMCVNNCNNIPDQNFVETECTADSDCSDTDYCAQGTCMPSGMCKGDEDCMNPNHLFADEKCIGYQYCDDDGYCSRNCGVPCKVESKTEQTQCTVTGCDRKIMCDGAVSCVPDMCSDDCDGIYFDTAGSVIADCSSSFDDDDMINSNTTASEDDRIITCSTTGDCPRGETIADGTYCGSDNTCLPMGFCSIPEDCSDFDNVFPVVACVGKMACEEGQCTMKCGVFDDEDEMNDDPNPPEDLDDTCTSNDDCVADGKYCTINGVCAPIGGCFVNEDCEDMNNQPYAVAMCVGTLFCSDENRCAKRCDGAPPINAEPDYESIIAEDDENDPVQISKPAAAEDNDDGNATVAISSSTYCTSNKDCLATFPEFVDGNYCAQGVCMAMGTCTTDSDCFNPINIFDDKRCIGYLKCENGLCDRICGEQCSDGSKPANCLVDPCNSRKLCDGAVSCRLDACSGTCKAVYYDAAGEVLTGCELFEGGLVAAAGAETEDADGSGGEPVVVMATASGSTATGYNKFESTVAFVFMSLSLLLI